jgi:hypothetical protein
MWEKKKDQRKICQYKKPPKRFSSETCMAGETGLEPATTRFGDVDSTIELLA